MSSFLFLQKGFYKIKLWTVKNFITSLAIYFDYNKIFYRKQTKIKILSILYLESLNEEIMKIREWILSKVYGVKDKDRKDKVKEDKRVINR
ncbi:MAG: hypothetical protein GXO21_03310 [Aquificae bacterium]|nr:hypothetical protein [Aquificota bacterium]